MKSYALIAAVMYLHGAQGVCTEPRIRKSWDALRAEGGTDLYIEAVQQAVRLGYQQDFSIPMWHKALLQMRRIDREALCFGIVVSCWPTRTC